MIHFLKGNLFEDDCEALVNTVNCVGIMGRGVALQFKERFPDNYKAYAKACKNKEVQIGKIFVYRLDSLVGPKWILNFPTKKHWKEKSEITYIIDGLNDLVSVIRENNIKSIALPPLGCGLGKLDWNTVKTLIVDRFSELNDVCVYVHEPDAMHTVVACVTEDRPKLTPASAALIALADFCQNNIFDPSLTLLKIHKVLYFLQAKGEPLKLNYDKGYYGPYAKNLRHVLKKLEGHYLTGFKIGEEKPNLPLYVLPEAVKQAQAVLEDNPEIVGRIESVKDLLEGFESTRGMELLATVHYVNKIESAKTPSQVYTAICNWSKRKARLFTELQVYNAFSVLKEKGWLELV